MGGEGLKKAPQRTSSRLFAAGKKNFAWEAFGSFGSAKRSLGGLSREPPI